MKIISHRGNIYGPDKTKENNPIHLIDVINKGFDVEIDVWFISNKWMLGHDFPEYEVNIEFLNKKEFWLHAKNGDAFYKLLNEKILNVFWHTNEDWILTSKGYIWTYPNKKLYPNSVCVLPELGYDGEIKNCFAICSDFIYKYKYENIDSVSRPY